MIAFWEIGAANAALEQDVADKGELSGIVIDHDMAGRVAGAMGDVEGLARQL